MFLFSNDEQIAEAMGFLYVAAGPMVRSSYKAGEFFMENHLKQREAEREKQRQNQQRQQVA